MARQSGAQRAVGHGTSVSHAPRHERAPWLQYDANRARSRDSLAFVDNRRRRDPRAQRGGVRNPLVALVLIVVGVLAHRPLRSDQNGQPLSTALFSRGSCISFAPTSGNRHETVFLDAGHGGIDPGAVGTTKSGMTIYEANETLPVELDAMALLRSDGYTVVVSRTRASSVVRLVPSDVTGRVLTLKGAHDDVAARDVCANLAKAAVLVGIYFNAGSSPTNAGSITAYDSDRPFWRASQALASLLQKDVVAGMNSHGWGIPNQGVLADGGLGSSVPTAPGTGGSLAADAARYNHLLLLGPSMSGYFTTPSEMPGAVIEPLFITDPFEGSIAASESGQHVIAQGIAKR